MIPLALTFLALSAHLYAQANPLAVVVGAVGVAFLFCAREARR